jgi:nitrile hydratase
MTDFQANTTQPIFKVGDRIVVKSGPPEQHCRTPSYLRGISGSVVEVMGQYQNPSLLAFHETCVSKIWLYRVHFEQVDIWPTYSGPNGDTVEADIYEHWLIPD